MPKALVFDGAIIILALGGSAGQDAKKARLMGEAWHEWTAQTAFIPFTRGARQSGHGRADRRHPAVPGRDLGAARCGMPAGFWRWIG